MQNFISNGQVWLAHDFMANLVPDDDPRQFWFEQAAATNASVNSPESDGYDYDNLAAAYIDTHSTWGVTVSQEIDGVIPSLSLQGVSNTLGTLVLETEISASLEGQPIPSLTNMIVDDVELALDAGA